MSASSSTINTSRAISPPVCLLFFGIVVCRVRLVARGRKQMHVECHAGDRSAAGPVQKLEAAEMLLDDLLDDGEAQPRSAHAGGDIGLGDAVPLAGKAEAVVQHRDDKPAGRSEERRVGKEW